MTAPFIPSDVFKSALIATESEGHARIDREFLKQARILNTRHETSGAEALASLRQDGADLVICDSRLADMDGRDFITTLRADAALANTPVILAAAGGTRHDVLTAVRLGAAGYCLRPYSLLTFQRHLSMAAHIRRFSESGRAALAGGMTGEVAGRPDEALLAFAALAESPDDAPRHFADGMAALSARDIERAIVSFHKALAANELYVEANLGLARAWNAKGVVRQFRHYMKRAAAACARAHRFVELRDQFLEMLAVDEAGFNPFLAIGNELVRERQYNAAVSLYRMALDLTPHNADAYVGLSRAYHFLRQPDQARKAVDKGLALNERSQEARAIHRQLHRHEEEVEILSLDDLEPLDAAEFPWMLRGMLYLAGLATEALMRPRREAQAA